MKIVKYLFVLSAILLVGLFVWKGTGKTKEVLPLESEPVFGTLSNSEGGVEVSITPKALEQDSWSFEVVLETHSVELSEDLQAVSFLIDRQGREYGAVSWEGSPPGGHHRKGILTFNPLSPTPAALKLKVREVGSVDERIFEWQLL